MQLEFNANKRDGQGTGASRRLRRTGRVPASSTAAPPPAADRHRPQRAVPAACARRRFYSSVLTANVDGGKKECACCATCSATPIASRSCTSISSASMPRMNAPEGAAALRQCRHRAGRQAGRRHGLARDERLDVRACPRTCRPHRGRSEGSGAGQSMHVSQLKLPAGCRSRPSRKATRWWRPSS
jgi:ribosomal protein L25 (general stress protein Ctc)